MEETQEKFLQLLREIKSEDERNSFLKWVRVNWNLDDIGNYDCSKQDDAEEILSSIADEIRPMVPFDAILPSEKINLPVCGPNSDCDSQTTVHVDEFLYTDEHIDELVEKGVLSRHYCGDCFSKNVKLLTFISHSMSINRIQYLFRCLLPPLKNEMILDVGSRLGPVLYGAFLYTSSSRIVGVETNPDFCKIQTQIVKKFNFSDRIKIICNNIFNEMDILSSADVIILNNVFEFFADVDKTISSWHLLAQSIKVGCVLVTVPHLSETFEHVKVNFDWKDWVEELEPYQQDNSFSDEDLESHRENMKHYKVKKKISVK